MASEVYINIKDLPELSEINNGDYILVETSTGTHTINFQNFLLPTDNTVITTTVNQNASAFNTYITDLSSSYNSLSTTVEYNKTLSDTVSTSLDNYKSSLSGIANTLISIGQITIPTGSYNASKVVSLYGGSNYTLDKIFISPANLYAALNPAYAESLDSNTSMITIRGTFNTKSLVYTNTGSTSLSVTNGDLNTVLNTLSLSTVYIPAQEDAVYNVLVVKT